jgi:predicted MFS family arabinose efflux permease
VTDQLSDQQRNARFALAVLFSINLMNFFDRQIAGVLVEPVKTEFHLTDTQIGWVNTAFTLVYAFIGVPLGRLTDTWRRTRLVSIGVTFWSLLTAASGLTTNYVTYLLSRIGVGVGEASCAPAGQSLIGDMYPPERRARAMAIFMMGLPLGLAAAYLLTSQIAKAFGWRTAYFVACIPGLLLALLAWYIKEPPRGTTDKHVITQQVSVADSFVSVLTIPTIWWIILSGLLFNFNAYAVNTFQVAFLQRFHHIDIAHAGRLSAVSLGLAGAIGLILGGWLGDRLRMRRENGRLLLAAVTMFCAAPCVFMALMQPRGSVGMFALLMGASTSMTFVYYATVYSAIQDVVPPNVRGTAVSLYFFGQYVLGAAFGTAIMGALSDYFANQAMVAAGAAVLAPEHSAQGLHNAMFVIPALMLLCAGSLFGAAATVVRDMRRMQDRMQAQGAVLAPSPS